MPINVGQAVGYLDLDTNNFKKGLASAFEDLKTFADNTQKLDKRMTALGKSLTTAGSTLSKNLTVPILSVGAASLKAGVEFESAFAGVIKTVDATEQELEGIKKGIVDMSRVMPQSASQIAEVAEAAGQLGIKTESILGFTETMVQLGDATNLSSTEAATALARLANITGMSQDDFDRLGSVIVALGNNLATTESEIVDMAQNLAAAGTQVGLTESEILAVAGALSSLGVEAAMGGTAFSKTLREMQMAVESGGTELENFAIVANMTSQDFVKVFKEDSATAIQAFLSGLGDTERLGSSTIKILKDLGVEETRMNDVLSRLSNANELVASSFELANEAWDENLALSKEASQRYETTESQLKILWNNVVEIGLQLSKVLLPVFKDLVKWLQKVVRWLGEMDEDTLKFVVAIGSLLATLGPVLSILGKTITTITKIIPKIKESTIAVTAFKTAMSVLSGPVGVVVAVVGALTAAIVLNANKTSILSKEYRELNKEIKENKESYEAKNKEIDKDSDAMMSNAIRAKELYNEMVDLSKQEMDTATKVSILTAMQKELKELVPDLVVEINKETGALETNQQTVDSLVQSYIDLSIAKRFEDKYTNETKRFLDATEARKEALENISRVEGEIKENQEWFNSLNLAGKSFGREGYLSKSMDLQRELSDFQKVKDEQDKIIEESKNSMQSFEKEKEEFTKSVYETLGLQVNLNKEVVESNKDAIKSNGEKVEQTKILTEEEKKAIEEAKKAKEKAFEAEKSRYEKLSKVTSDYYEEVTSIQEEANERLQQIYDDESERIQEVTDEYNKALEDRKSAIRGAYGLFDEFAKADENSLSGKELLKNLKSQLKGIQEWKENLEELSERGITEGLLEELRELGPKAAVEIENLNKLSDKKLEEYVTTWESLNKEIEDQAIRELDPQLQEMETQISNIQQETFDKIAELNSSVEQEIDSLTLKYIDSIKELGVNVIPESTNTGIEIIKAIEIGVEESEESLIGKLEELKERVKQIVRQIKRDVASAESAADSIDGSHANGLDYVPYNGYIAQLHQGERVLTKQENKAYNEGKVNASGNQTLNVNFTGSLGQLIRVLNPQFTLEDDRGGVQY